MGKPDNKRRGTPSNYPDDGNAFSMMLGAMSAGELTDALDDVLENITEENYDPSLIDAYLDALDRKDPVPEAPDAGTSYAGFQKRLLKMVPECGNKPEAPVRKARRFWRTGLAAVLAAVCILGGMVIAQAAGWDVFGTVARWTDTIFSFGEIRSDGAGDVPYTNHRNDGEEFVSLQEALDVYGITEVSEPEWIPEGYTSKSITADYWPDGDMMRLLAEYSNGTDTLFVELSSCRDKPSMQVEKTDAPVETFTVNHMAVYFIENISNNAAAWMTEHYECYIAGAIEKDALRQMVLSIYADA